MSIRFKTFPWAHENFDDYKTEEGEIRYYLTPDGKFPSMTSLLKQLDDGGIEKWRQRVGEEEADRITIEASERGNALHYYNELYLQNKLIRSDLKGQARTLFNRVKPYLDDIEIMIATEVALYNKVDGYAGRVDAIGILFDELTIIDHKNSRNPINLSVPYAKKKIFKYMVQCSGYARALYTMKGIQATKGCLIVGNHLTSSSDRFIFPIDPLYKELDILVHAYHNNGEGLEKSMFFDEDMDLSFVNVY